MKIIDRICVSSLDIKCITCRYFDYGNHQSLLNSGNHESNCRKLHGVIFQDGKFMFFKQAVIDNSRGMTEISFNVLLKIDCKDYKDLGSSV